MRLEDGPRPKVKYRHYKGRTYEVVDHGTYCTGHRLEPVVIYRDEDGETWVRSHADFFSKLPDGTLRFTKVEE